MEVLVWGIGIGIAHAYSSLLLKATQNFKISDATPGFDIFNFLLPRDQIDVIPNFHPLPMRSSSKTQPLRLGTETTAIADGLQNASPSISSSTSSDVNNPLIQLARDFVYNKSRFFSSYDPSAYSDDFIFRGPYIGPLNKNDYFSTMDTFKVYKALPDINPNAWGFSIDPKYPSRVWYWTRNTGTFNGEHIGVGNGLSIPPNGAVLDGCPETHSIIFDDDQKVKLLTVGYVADRFEGNTKYSKDLPVWWASTESRRYIFCSLFNYLIESSPM